MPVNLSVKNAPDDIVKRLKQRAARHHRSLQGELMAILEAAADEAPRPLSAGDALARIRAAGLATPSTSVSTPRGPRGTRCPSPSLRLDR